METLRQTASPTAKVVRGNGGVDAIAAKDLVPGNIIHIAAGDSIPADARLIEVLTLEVDEAMLTGESLPVEKKHTRIPNPEQPLADRTNMCYLGTNVTKGRATAVVTATGMNTQMGKIAKSLMSSDEDSASTPLQKRLNVLAMILLALAIVLAIIVFAVNDFVLSAEAALYAVSVGIAMIPEGLVAVVTLTMALGVRRMALQKAIVRKLAALETLGSVTDICSDKTGTLTQGNMVLTKVYLPDEGYFEVSGSGFNPEGHIIPVEGPANKMTLENMSEGFTRLVQCAALCNTASIHKEEQGDFEAAEKNQAPVWKGSGDPTEVALQVFAHKLHAGGPALLRGPLSDDKDDPRTHGEQADETQRGDWTVESEYPFDSSLKRMSALLTHHPTQQAIVFTKGGLESVLPLCTRRWDGRLGHAVDINTAQYMEALQDNISTMASEGLRVLSLAYKPFGSTANGIPTNTAREEVECDLIFIGLVGINDPPRAETAHAVASCHRADITVRMLTGDHPQTAAAIARRVGILSREGTSESHTTLHVDGPFDQRTGDARVVWTGTEFDALSDAQVDKMAELPLVIARCTPQTKVKMIDALARRKKVSAMTGDGVNDSPSLKRAPVGIAMGLGGSDVAKQAAAIVLTDDNFATIVGAIAQGRRIFANIQKFALHLMTTNVSEVIALIIGLAFKDSAGQSVYPLSPLQILFLNMITSSPPAMALGIEEPEPHQMRSARYRGGPLFTKTVLADIFFYGIVMGILNLGGFLLVIYGFGDGNLGVECNQAHPYNAELAEGCSTVYRARGTSYLTLTWLILIHAYVCRHHYHSIFRGGFRQMITSNKALAYTCVSGFLVVIPTLYIPGTTTVFKHSGLTWEWGIVVISCLVYIAAAEAYKYGWRRWLRKREMLTGDGLEMERVATQAV
ncbi:Na+/K+ P-type ATPase [Fimicolochytrium jonesii]|uniref:Na+/K+ P-type ATPase n=1 Tax=Fimicolochytrium jonesii TaxID=1396493 RepID=UPI0022FE00B8|nr:Na+/K+ P-type ATPase [Fimicolochytrium jonesii]KAI8820999.1 Na+/K+ P-type ATPase [Fimicolochytrium jonesii]